MRRVQLRDVTFEAIWAPNIEDENRFGSRYVSVPEDFMALRQIYHEFHFDSWYKEFTSRYGNDGELFWGELSRWEIHGNILFAKQKSEACLDVASYYGGSGKYSGD